MIRRIGAEQLKTAVISSADICKSRYKCIACDLFTQRFAKPEKRTNFKLFFIFLSLSEIRGFIQKSFNSFRTPSSSVPSSSVCLLTTRRSKIHSRDRPERISKSPVSSIRCQLELFKYHNRFAVISCKYHISLQQRYKFFYLRII